MIMARSSALRPCGPSSGGPCASTASHCAQEVGGASVTLLQAVLNGDRPVFEAVVTVVLVAVSGKPLRVSQEVREAFGSLPGA